MTKSLAASQKVMKNYLSELMTDDIEQPVKQALDSPRLEKLLETVKPETITASKRISKEKIVLKVSPAENNKTMASQVEKPVLLDEKPLETRKSQGDVNVAAERNYRQGSFQAMFFDVAGLIIAVPLIELGGIHNADKTNSIVGKPSWFKGVMLHREEKISVVDTALWVMPEKCNEKLINALNYQYIIMLNDTPWGLLAEHLVDTVTLQQEDVKWLDEPSKRPWLAGLVKDRMCALLDVNALTKLLDEGAGITQ